MSLAKGVPPGVDGQLPGAGVALSEVTLHRLRARAKYVPTLLRLQAISMVRRSQSSPEYLPPRQQRGLGPGG